MQGWGLWVGTIRMKDFGAEARRDAAASGDVRAEAALFISRRRGVRAAPLVLHDPVQPPESVGLADGMAEPEAAPGLPPDSPSERAAWIARQLAADCFHFARPGTGRR